MTTTEKLELGGLIGDPLIDFFFGNEDRIRKEFEERFAVTLFDTALDTLNEFEGRYVASEQAAAAHFVAVCKPIDLDADLATLATSHESPAERPLALRLVPTDQVFTQGSEEHSIGEPHSVLLELLSLVPVAAEHASEPERFHVAAESFKVAGEELPPEAVGLLRSLYELTDAQMWHDGFGDEPSDSEVAVWKGHYGLMKVPVYFALVSDRRDGDMPELSVTLFGGAPEEAEAALRDWAVLRFGGRPSAAIQKKLRGENEPEVAAMSPELPQRLKGILKLDTSNPNDQQTAKAADTDSLDMLPDPVAALTSLGTIDKAS